MWKFFEKLKQGLSKTHQGFVEKIDQLFLGKKTIDQDVLDELEALLFEADLGVKTSSQLIEGVRQGLKRGDLKEPERVRGVGAHIKKSEGFPSPFSLTRQTRYFLLTSSKSASTTSSCAFGRGPSWGPASAPGPAAPFWEALAYMASANL